MYFYNVVKKYVLIQTMNKLINPTKISIKSETFWNQKNANLI